MIIGRNMAGRYSKKGKLEKGLNVLRKKVEGI
jgi:hypothetical protein